MRTCGTWSAYCGGCRCDDCRAAARLYMDGKRKRYTLTCAHCGREWETQNRKAKYCSNLCQAEYEHGPERGAAARRRRQRQERARRKLAVAAAGAHGEGAWTAGTCIRCGKSAVSAPWQQIGSLFYCSRRCRKAANAPCRGHGVNRQEIYKRDKYRCYRCKRRVRLDKVPPHPLSPTLDHLVTVKEDPSRARDPANLRTCCWDCNIKKGDRGGGEQLMLFG